MNRGTAWYPTLVLLIASGMMLACGPSGDTAGPSAPMPGKGQPGAVMPDPGPEQAGEITEFLRAWVVEQTGEAEAYNIPAQGGLDVSGQLTGFHSVHQKDHDSYWVCADFEGGGDVYDVDFFVEDTPVGLVVLEHYLHKVNGEEVGG